MSIKKPSVKQILLGTMWTIIGLGSMLLLVAAAHRKNKRICKSVVVDIRGVSNNFFIDETDVKKIINSYAGSKAIGTPVEQINLRMIEAQLKKEVWINNAELFFDNNDVLKADIEEREPVARIFTTTGRTFYIDSACMMLPLSDKISARLPLFTGFTSDARVLSKPDSALLLDIRNLSMMMHDDPFLVGMIEQIDITEQRGFEMLPKIGRQLIVFGDATDAAAKFQKLKLFYKNVMVKAGWNKYSTINLKYNNQVVAKLRGREDIAADSLRTLQLMKQIAENAAEASADSARLFVPATDKIVATDTTLIQQSMERDEAAETDAPTPDPAIITVPLREVKPQELPKKTVIKPVAKPVIKPAVKPVVKPVIKKVTAPIKPSPAKPVPKAVMKSNDY